MLHRYFVAALLLEERSQRSDINREGRLTLLQAVLASPPCPPLSPPSSCNGISGDRRKYGMDLRTLPCPEPHAPFRQDVF